MSIRIGDIEFTAVQSIRTVENRSTVNYNIPGHNGSKRYDFGRKPTELILEGLVVDKDTIMAIESLREAQTESKPLTFSADIVAGVEFADITIEDLSINQVAGYKQRYRFYIKVQEYIKPPEPESSTMDSIDKKLALDADSWAKNEMEIGELLENPLKIPDALKKNSGLLDQLSVSSLGNALKSLKDSISGAGFAKIMGAIAKIDFKKVIAVIKDIKESGGIANYIKKMAKEGILDICKELGVDPDLAEGILLVINGGTDFIDKLEKVIDRGKDVLEAIKDLSLIENIEDTIKKFKTG